MRDIGPALSEVMARARGRLSLEHAARERVLPLCREVIRHSANTIRAVHRGEFDQARSILQQAQSCLQQAVEALADVPSVYYTGYVQDAQKEYSEASVTLAVVAGEILPDPASLKVEVAAYLNGLGEAAGELRRYLLDQIRRGDSTNWEVCLQAMDDIYSELVTVDFPDAITGGLRRTTDMVRGVLERTRGDLTLAARQEELTAKLEELSARLGRP